MSGVILYSPLYASMVRIGTTLPLFDLIIGSHVAFP
jgi:hypothetical protein